MPPQKSADDANAPAKAKGSNALPSLLASPPASRRFPDNLDRLTVTDLRKPAKTWVGPNQAKMSKEPLRAALSKALRDDAEARRVVESLRPEERAVAAVYRRYGGTVDGSLIRIDLMARGLLEIVEENRYGYSSRKWKRDLIQNLADAWVLIEENPGPYRYYSSYYDTTSTFASYALHPGIARYVEPAGPARWSIPAAKEIPEVITRYPAAEVAVELSQVYSYFAARDSVKTRKDGMLTTAVLRSLEKAVPLESGGDYHLPDRHALAIEILKSAGAIRQEGNVALADPNAATRLFTLPDALQAHAWARGWLTADGWFDGQGVPDTGDGDDHGEGVRSARKILAWTLGALAQDGDRWIGLNAFLGGLHDLIGNLHISLPYGRPAWDPRLPGARDKEKQQGLKRQHAYWFDREGKFFANALMVSLVSLGLVERATTKTGKGNGPAESLLFRLTEIGRAIFGAPEVAPPVADGGDERRFLVIQPNFDVVAYLEQADAASAGLLGRIAEHDLARTGPVQTFRLTQKSIYLAQEGGLTHNRIVEFLQTRGQPDLPPNVLRTIADWSHKRETLTVRSGITLLGFPSAADRDAYLRKQPENIRPLGDRFVLAPAANNAPKTLGGAGTISLDHRGSTRRDWGLDEFGRITLLGRLDIVQVARLRRIAELDPARGWTITGDSIRRAAAGGMTGAKIRRWLEDNLDTAPPALIFEAINAWAGRKSNVELGDAVLLHIPDEDQFDAIIESDRFKPFLLGSPGDNWLAVRPEARKELTDLLEELGFTVRGDLAHDAIDLEYDAGDDFDW
jgi:hypothetical protein